MIPKKTQEKLASSHPMGTRHKAKLDIALSLLGEGHPVDAVVATLRSKFPEAELHEITKLVDWCASRNPQPCTRAIPGSLGPIPSLPRAPKSALTRPGALPTPLTAKEAVSALLSGPTKPLVSPVPVPEDPLEAISLLFTSLYAPEEHINILTHFSASASRACPVGSGANKLRDHWLSWFAQHGIPSRDAGAWMRPNPVAPAGSGKDGAITNADIAAFRFLLLESDEIPMHDQMAVYAELALPLSAIISSGGKSCHAWLRIDALDAEEYELKATRILAALATLGFDKANKNPSRLSRLPGAKRVIGASGDGLQSLRFLDPDAAPITEEQIARLELRVRPPRFKNIGMREAIFTALEHYEEIYSNKSKTGLRTGFERFDAITGGMKPGWLTIVAGETNAGKTSFALNIVLHALRQGKAVVLFSFEMEMQEIVDILFAERGGINRNHFNNGEFSQADLNGMPEVAQELLGFPLFVFDDPLMTAQDMTEACQQISLTQEVSLVVVDYLQLANVENPRDNREQQVAATSRACKALAKRLGCPVLGVSQLNDEGKMRDSRAIAHVANCVLKVIEDPAGGIILQVAKGRSIPKGSYFFEFEREYCRFIETGCDERLETLLPRARETIPQPALL